MPDDCLPCQWPGLRLRRIDDRGQQRAARPCGPASRNAATASSCLSGDGSASCLTKRSQAGRIVPFGRRRGEDLLDELCACGFSDLSPAICMSVALPKCRARSASAAASGLAAKKLIEKLLRQIGAIECRRAKRPLGATRAAFSASNRQLCRPPDRVDGRWQPRPASLRPLPAFFAGGGAGLASLFDWPLFRLGAQRDRRQTRSSQRRRLSRSIFGCCAS